MFFKILKIILLLRARLHSPGSSCLYGGLATILQALGRFPIISGFPILFLVAVPKFALADNFERQNIYLKVVAYSVPVMSGPGGSYSQIGRIGKGDIFKAIDRSPDGAWYCIQATRGYVGWVFTELVWPFMLLEDIEKRGTESWFSKNIVGPSILANDQFTLSVSGGILEHDSVFLTKIGYQPNRRVLVEFSTAYILGESQDFWLGFFELTLMLGPWRSLVPFLSAGAGAASVYPHRQADLFESEIYGLVTAGGGMLISLSGSFMMRIDARRMMLVARERSMGMLGLTLGGMIRY